MALAGANELFVILVAPNVSEHMGGEAIKALQIYLELERAGVRVHQITHDRVKTELTKNYPGLQVSYVRDTWFQVMLYRSKVLAPLLGIVFLWRATRMARKLAEAHPGAVVHFTAPVSPILPYFRIQGQRVVIGPLNGNIHYPKAFRNVEPLTYKIRRWAHPILQVLLRVGPRGKQHADALLNSGGERTYKSLRMCGCRDSQIVDSIDSGVLDRLHGSPRVTHSGVNLKFFQNGRLVCHKGTDLVIKALKQTANPVEFDVIGRGDQLETLRALTAELGLQDRVHFIEWVPDHSQLSDKLRSYRGLVFPSLAEANGIVVQEAMVLGLPVIALNWGGPAALVTVQSGVLIEPLGEEHVVRELARAMDRLSEDGELADRMAIAGRERALRDGYLWSGIAADFIRLYRRLVGGVEVVAEGTKERVGA